MLNYIQHLKRTRPNMLMNQINAMKKHKLWLKDKIPD